VQRRGETLKIAAADGVMPAVVWTPGAPVRRPGVLLLADAYGLTPHVESVAER
jgi:dienelactone hydrolase